MQAEKAQATLYKSWYEAAESQLSQLQEEFKKLQQYIARVATFDERSKADKGVQLFYAYSFGGKIAQAWLARIKELERQLQSINAKIAEDRAESERQSVDAKEVLAARDELQCNNLLFFIMQPKFKFWKITRLRCSIKYKHLRKRLTTLKRIINTSLWRMQKTSDD